MAKVYSVVLTLFYLGFLRVARLEGGEGGGGRKVPATHYSKTINDNGMKSGEVVTDKQHSFNFADYL